MPRFAPCGREYRRDSEGQFGSGKKELCREPRFCPHCKRIRELTEELHTLKFPRVVKIAGGSAQFYKNQPPGRLTELHGADPADVEDAEVVSDTEDKDETKGGVT